MRTWDRLKLDCPINAMYATNPTQQVSQWAQTCMCGTFSVYSRLWDCMESLWFIHCDMLLRQPHTVHYMYLSKATKCRTSSATRLIYSGCCIRLCLWNNKEEITIRTGSKDDWNFCNKLCTRQKEKKKIPKMIIVIWFIFWSVVRMALHLSLHIAETVVRSHQVKTSESSWCLMTMCRNNAECRKSSKKTPLFPNKTATMCELI